MRFPRFAFVEGPSLSAAVRLELTDSEVFPGVDPGVTAEGFALGAPSLSGDVGGAGREWEFRAGLTVSLTVTDQNRTSMLRLQSAVAREVLREENWLLVQTEPHRAPVFYRTYRSPLSDLDLTDVYDESSPLTSRLAWDLVLDADPFGFGEEIRAGSATVSNDPLAASNPMRLDLPPALGDSPARVRVQVDPSQASRMDGYRWLLHSCPDDGRDAVVYDLTSASWTAGIDTGGDVADAGSVGGSVREVSFATSSALTGRLTSSGLPSLPLGKWRALARVARLDPSAPYDSSYVIRASVNGVEGRKETMQRKASASDGHATWVDLGSFRHPRAAANPPGREGTAPAPEITLSASRLSGVGTLRLDALILLPEARDHGLTTSPKARSMGFDFDTVGCGVPAGPGFAVFDGIDESLWGVDGDGVTASLMASPRGGWPLLWPGVDNRLWVFQQANSAGIEGVDSSDDITATTQVSVDYHPQHLNLPAD